MMAAQSFIAGQPTGGIDGSDRAGKTCSPAHQVSLRKPDGTHCAFAAKPGVPLLQAMIAANVSAIQIGCRGGGCGVCRVRVLDGTYSSMPMSRSRISASDEAAGVVLACRIVPQGDLAIEVFPLPRRKPDSVRTIASGCAAAAQRSGE